MLKVSNITSIRSGEAVRNQFKIVTDEKVFFQSYDSLIAEYDCTTRKLKLGLHFDYSVTTSKYLHQFIDENVPYDIAYAIDTYSGSYSKKLRSDITDGIIDYDYNMV